MRSYTQPRTHSHVHARTYSRPASRSLASRLMGLPPSPADASSSSLLVAESNLDLDIPVLKGSSSFLQAALVLLAVPAMIFAGE